MVKEDGGILLWRDQGVRDDRMGCRSDDGNRDDSDRSRVFATESNGGRGVHNLEFVLQQMYEMLRTRTSQEANGIVAKSRKNPLERGDGHMNDTTYCWRKEKEHPSRHHFSGRCSLQELQAGIERWESKVVRYEKLKGKLDDEIQRVGLEALVPEELEKHLIFNSNRL